MAERRRQLWYVVTGYGSQWHGMGRGLMPLRPFAEAIHSCAEVLRAYDVDLLAVIESSDEKTYDNILNTYLGIVSIEIGLYETLKRLGLSPDGFLGHSFGEIACSYIDGAFTLEQTILAAYHRGKSLLDSNLTPGAMAVMNRPYEEVVQMIPEGITAACDNTDKCVTICGPVDLLSKYVDELAEAGIKTKVYPTGFAFHSAYIAPAGPLLKEKYLELIPEPKPRSKRWISSSVAKADWSKPLAATCSAEYHLNNFLRPVLFRQALSEVPGGSLVVELSPYSLLLSLLDDFLDGCVTVGLVRKDSQDHIGFLKKSIQTIYDELKLEDLDSKWDLLFENKE